MILRDWSKPWDPTAEFVFTAPAPKMLDRDYVPGDRVPEAVRAHLGVTGLLAFWKAGRIARADGVYNLPTVAKQDTTPETPVLEPAHVGPSTDTSVEILTPIEPPKRKRGRPRKNPLPVAPAADDSSRDQ